jgi:hypothetical protein
MSNALATVSTIADISPADAALAAEAATVGDLSALSPEKRTQLYGAICRSVGLNPLTKPFEYIKLNGKLTLYALKGATDQLRKVNGVSITKIEMNAVNGILMVTAYAQDASGRTDSDLGAVPIGNLQGEALANAHMKAITKAKRRVTLSIAGLGWLDESEVESIPPQRAQPVHVDMETGEIQPTNTQERPRATIERIHVPEVIDDEDERVRAISDLIDAAMEHGYTEDDIEVYFDRAGIDPDTADVARIQNVTNGINRNPVLFGETVEKHRLQMQAANDPELQPSDEQLGIK